MASADLVGAGGSYVRAKEVLEHASGLSSEFLRWTWEADREALDSHLIDRAAFDALSRGDLPAFLAHRAERLRTEVTAFLSHRAGVGEPLLFPVTSYYDDAEPAGT